MFFFLLSRARPSTTIHHPPSHPSIQAGSRLGPRRAGILRQRIGRITTSQGKSNKSQIKSALGSRLLAFGFQLSAFGFRLSDQSENFTLDQLHKSAGKKVVLKKWWVKKRWVKKRWGLKKSRGKNKWG